MSGIQTKDTMPKLGHVTDLREQWLVRADVALAHRLQDREISSHLCENRYRNQQIREDFPVAVSEQRGIEHEVWLREQALRRQAEIDANIARELAAINLRKQRRHQLPEPQQPQSSCSTRIVPAIDPDELGLSASELEEMRRRLEQEEKDARLARQLSQQSEGQDEILADMRCAVEAQDGELARLLQEREYKKLQRAKEKARQKALLKKQQRLAMQLELEAPPQTVLCDAYSNPRDMIKENGLRLCKSVDSDLHYVEPFEKEQIQSKASAILSKEKSKQYYTQGASSSNANNLHVHMQPVDLEKTAAYHSLVHRQVPPPPSTGKKPRFPDPISIRPASHYPTDNMANGDSPITLLTHSVSEDTNLYNSSFQSEHNLGSHSFERREPSKRLLNSDITAESLEKKNNKPVAMQKKNRGCKIQ